MKSQPVCERLTSLALPGVSFYSHQYQLASGSYANIVLDGVRIVVNNPNVFRPVLTSIAIIACLQNLYGIKKVWNHKNTRADFFDKLYGTDSVRQALLDGVDPRQICRQWASDLRAFQRTRKPCLLYHT